jgi:hypothetical protein
LPHHRLNQYAPITGAPSTQRLAVGHVHSAAVRLSRAHCPPHCARLSFSGYSDWPERPEVRIQPGPCSSGGRRMRRVLKCGRTLGGGNFMMADIYSRWWRIRGYRKRSSADG